MFPEQLGRRITIAPVLWLDVSRISNWTATASEDGVSYVYPRIKEASKAAHVYLRIKEASKAVQQ